MNTTNIVNRGFNFLFLPDRFTIKETNLIIKKISSSIDKFEYHLEKEDSFSNQLSIYKSELSSLKENLQLSKTGQIFRDLFIGKEVLNPEYIKCIAHIKKVKNKICYLEDLKNLDLTVNRYTKQHPNAKTLIIKISDDLIVNIHEGVIKNSSKVIKSLIDEINQDGSDSIDLSLLSIPSESLIESLQFAYSSIFDPTKLVTTLQGIDALNIEIPKHASIKAVQYFLKDFRDYSNTFVRCYDQLSIKSLPRTERLELLHFFLQRSDQFDSGIILQQIKKNISFFQDYKENKIFEYMLAIFKNDRVSHPFTFPIQAVFSSKESAIIKSNINMSHKFLIGLKTKQLQLQNTDNKEIENLKNRMSSFKYWCSNNFMSFFGDLFDVQYDNVPSDFINIFPKEYIFITSCLAFLQRPLTRQGWGILENQLYKNMKNGHAWSAYLMAALTQIGCFNTFKPTTLLARSHQLGNRYATFQYAQKMMPYNQDVALKLFEKAGNKGLSEGWLQIAIYYESNQEFNLAIAFCQKVIDSASSSPLLKDRAEKLTLLVKDSLET